MARLLVTTLLAPGLLACAASQTAPDRADESGSMPSSQSPSSTPSPSESPPTHPMSNQSPLPTLKPPTGPPTEPSHVFKPLTLSGTVRQGIYDGCVGLVTTDELHYVLVGPLSARLASGQQVTLRGVPAPHRETSCSGVVLEVRELLGVPE